MTVILLLLQAAAQSPCSGCHAEIAARHARSNHALALARFNELTAARFFKESGIGERNGATYEYAPREGAGEVTARLNGQTAAARLEWLFGAGAQGQTPVGRDARGRYLEHRLSSYPKTGRLGRTFGHPPAAPSDVDGALGLVNDSKTIFSCFNCHAGNVKAGPVLDEIRPGVTCERCHGSGEAHRANPQKRLVNPGRFGPKESLLFCAECHRSPGQAEESPEIADPVSVRFAPIGLAASRCFIASGKLSCLTCHDPHANAHPRTGAAFYAQVCRGCHAAGPRRTRCPRATQQDCVSCHMPPVALTPFLNFTDHRIRVR